MKHALKIIIPLVLVVVLLIGAALFFLVFRPDLTCEFYVSRAEAALAQGRPQRAVRWYARAWDLYPEDAALAIALADAYKQADNYTKAEYTLVSAITTLPDELSLYLELSRTYVEQDKLLDADQMLSRTANAGIQQQLAALRPAAPVIQPEGGVYDEYIEVSLSYGGGTAYLSPDGDFPSLGRDLYTAPVTLEEGESTVMAIVVSDDGLVSPAVTSAYTIGGIVEEVAFLDGNVENAVRAVLDKEDGSAVLSSDLWALTTLELPPEVKDLSDLLPCRALSDLSIHGAYGIDFSVLAQLTGLESLDLSECTVSSNSLAAIASLPQLKSLKLSGCALTNISALSSLSVLETLDLSNNAISDIDALSGLQNLLDVTLSNNTIGSIAPLAASRGLERLDISDNQVAVLTPLNNKTALKALIAVNNQIADLGPLSSCAALETLDVSGNAVSDLSPVMELASLSVLSADNNTIAELPAVSKTPALTQISLAHNQLTALPDLTSLLSFSYLNIDYNAVRDLTGLAECPALVEVDAFANPVGDVSALLERSIIVNYDPTYTLPEEPADESDGGSDDSGAD